MQAPHSPPESLRIPADFEPQEALVFGCGQLVKAYPQTFVDFVRCTHERVKLFGVVSGKHVRLAEILLSVAGLPKDSVEYLVADTSAMWVRDFSPISALNESGKRVFLNFDYGHMNLRNDLALRRLFEEYFDGTFVDVSLSLEGGNLLSNGAGLVLTSKTVNSQNAARGDLQFINKVLRAATGCSQWASVNSLNGERTGHVDLMASFLTPTRLLVGQADPSEDSFNAHILDDIASSLNGLATAAGPLEVVRIPMPRSADGMIRSYTNLLMVNGLVLVPTYPTVDPGMDRRVVNLLSELLPSHEVRGLDCSNIVNKGGSIHCMSMNVACPVNVGSSIASPRRQGDRLKLEASGTGSREQMPPIV